MKYESEICQVEVACDAQFGTLKFDQLSKSIQFDDMIILKTKKT